MKRLFLILCLFLVGCNSVPYPGDYAELPPDGKVVYVNNTPGNQPYRIIQVGPCFINQIISYGHWAVINKAFIGNSPAVNCAGIMPNPEK